ncbi:MAG: tRNA pseudouridine(65) synthase TruC [Rhodothermales bacterium]
MLEILYQDDDLVAINKPSGLLVHRSRIDRTATEFALQRVRDQIGQRVYPIHRLDKPTSGVLLFGLSPEAARTLNLVFAERRVQKTYLAVVRGHPPTHVTIDRPLKPLRDKTTDAKAAPDPEPQPAVTHLRTLVTSERPFSIGKYPTSRYALVEAKPETGRMHQIRRHLNGIAHPILGDGKHGDYRHNHYLRDHLSIMRLLLHAHQLTLPHCGNLLTLTAPLPADLQAALHQLGLNS